MNVTTIAATRVPRQRNRTVLAMIAVVTLGTAAVVHVDEGTAAGKVDSKAKTRDISGESITKDHKGEIDVLKPGAGGQAGKPRPRSKATASGTRQQRKEASGSTDQPGR